MRNVRRSQVREDRKKRRVIYLTFGIMLFIYLTLNIIVGENGLVKYMQLRSMKQRLLTETAALKIQNDEIKNQIEAFKKEPESIEELAREFGLTKEGELIYKFED
jgi:cell division protein FtsB